ncbi:LOW QUALITY PROTEIN: EKC/KEOPS complex subunit TP53RK [Drosophila subobscura]|uniref:LOW QUALITY PROTEIN: EKC/KEOPS complex subunit TP53RK n=1 Tax=Drosophila subobscura TaxID=7241 RepID=UPI00155A748B|nr:LOW QUALITY PROTEIN: EKC/KEOPS complex subunit TP53RK [Drosophila subobscura]
MDKEIIKQGAEARLYLGKYEGETCLIKERFVKKYRHPDLDKQITRRRMKAEMKTAARCLAAGVLVPKVLHLDYRTHTLYIEYYAKAKTAKEFIQETVATQEPGEAKKILQDLCCRIGVIVGRMHFDHIIHGDLTTSNILIDPQENKYDIVFIDFGLSHYDKGAERKGVDLYVLERALLSTHSEQPYLFDFILEGYRVQCGAEGLLVLAKFEEVRARGRKRTMIG